MSPPPAVMALRYHERTKHQFGRFAPSLGYLDWAMQPDPFRRFAGAPVHALPHAPLTAGVPYEALFGQGPPAAAVTDHAVGELLRCSLGLSAWKQAGRSRWALRVNPSSGNLHPTEAYVVRAGRVLHYAPREHGLETRCVLAASDRAASDADAAAPFLVALTSIHWREAWKYGERAFRYCQHDAGHAIAALRCAAALLGWRLALLPEWSDADVSALLGLDRGADFAGAEPEAPVCLALVGADARLSAHRPDRRALIAAAVGGQWTGRANRLSPSRVAWPAIDDVAAATIYPGLPPAALLPSTLPPSPPAAAPLARAVLLSRRSALAFDGRGSLPSATLGRMLRRLRPPTPPWDAIDWPPHVHLVLFVHRVDGLTPGLYAYLRDPAVLPDWKAAMRQEFLWEPAQAGNGADDPNALFLLVPIDCRRIATRVSCDQDIAEDGFFSLAMIARLEPALRERGEWFYRRLFWECGLVGQVLYLEAEAAGARATGIGCFYDDPVHEMLGLDGHGWQSLYHFSMGRPVEDSRLTSAPGYEWEGS